MRLIFIIIIVVVAGRAVPRSEHNGMIIWCNPVLLQPTFFPFCGSHQGVVVVGLLLLLGGLFILAWRWHSGKKWFSSFFCCCRCYYHRMRQDDWQVDRPLLSVSILRLLPSTICHHAAGPVAKMPTQIMTNNMTFLLPFSYSVLGRESLQLNVYRPTSIKLTITRFSNSELCEISTALCDVRVKTNQ